MKTKVTCEQVNALYDMVGDVKFIELQSLESDGLRVLLDGLETDSFVLDGSGEEVVAA